MFIKEIADLKAPSYEIDKGEEIQFLGEPLMDS
jgi:hypothetical protein